MEFHIEKSRFSGKSQFKLQNCADLGHLSNRDFTVLCYSLNPKLIKTGNFIYECEFEQIHMIKIGKVLTCDRVTKDKRTQFPSDFARAE